VVWFGSSDNFASLSPTGFSYSEATGVLGSQQVGYGVTFDFGRRAMLWSGTPESRVDLHPAGYVSSQAMGVSGGVQVGFGTPIGSPNSHALLWTGTPESVVELNQFLPDGFTGAVARAVDSDGNIVGFATGPGVQHAVMWVPQPPAAQPTQQSSSLR
jgi:hypothetical protein